MTFEQSDYKLALVWRYYKTFLMTESFKRIAATTTPDLSSLDLSFWDSLLYETVYRSIPHTLQELNTNITNAVNETNIAQISRVPMYMVKRVDKCMT